MAKGFHLLKLFNTVFFILISILVTAQVETDSTLTDISLFRDSCAIGKSSSLLVDSNNVVNLSNILQHRNWQPYDYYGLKKNFVPPYWLTKPIYLKFRLRNSSKNIDTVYFFPGNSFRSIDLFAVLEGHKLLEVKDESMNDGFQPIYLGPNQETTFIASLGITKKVQNTMTPIIIRKIYLKKFKQISYAFNYDLLVVGYMLSGLLLMMIIFNAANFRFGKNREFLYNCCYAICMFLLIFFNTFMQRRGGIYASFFMGYLAFILLIGGIVFYISFTRKFLETEKNYPLLNKIFLFEEKILITLLLFFTIVYYFTNLFWLQSLIENFTKIITLIIGLIYIGIAFKKKNKLMNYLAGGNAIFIFFSIISFLLIQFPFKESNAVTSAIVYFELGIVCELIFFLLGLSYKNRIELIGMVQAQEAMKLKAEKQNFESKLAILAAQQEERNRISTDMHDDLGAGVTAIRLFSELAKSRLGSNSVPEIDRISTSANELLNNMNAIIWTMNNNNDSFGNLVAYIRSYALEYFENTGIKCSVYIEEGLPNFVVSGQIRRNVFLVAKEALNNILKHAKATEVVLTLKRQDNGISLFIQDNGNGIDLNNIRQFGNGLKNMKKRMEKSGIALSIENNNGTLVKLHAQRLH